MASHYVFYDSTDTGIGMSASTAPDYAQKYGWTAVGIGSLQELRDAFDRLKTANTRIARLLVTTHGGPGRISFGGQRLDVTNLAWITGRGYEEVFENGARVFLDGCNVAEGNAGSTFLRKLGEAFFIKVSGSIAASTSVGLGNPFGAGVYHLWGEVKRLYFAPGPRLVEEFVQ
jgi:hypothetical protein